MSGALLFLAGAALGAAITAIIRKPARALSAPGAGPPLPEDLLGSDTANHLAANLADESTFEPLASVLVERCAVRVALPTALAMRERSGGAASIVAVAGGLDARLLGIVVELDSPAGRAITDGTPVVSGPDENVVSLAKGERRRKASSGIAVPIAQGGRVYGAVIAFGEPALGAGHAIEGLSNEVKKFAPVIIPAYAAAAAAKRAETDELTQLVNRRGLNAAIARLGTDRAALILIDLDHFKAINDSHGHQAGDTALKQVAVLLREAIRPRDTAARIGGEEFALWLPGADLEGAREVAERVRASVADAPLQAGGTAMTLSVSCGVAAYPKPIGAVQNLMGAADAALYAAKNAGRNRVVASMDQAR